MTVSPMQFIQCKLTAQGQSQVCLRGLVAYGQRQACKYGRRIMKHADS